MSTLHPISSIPQLPLPSQFARVDSEWLKTVGKVSLVASVIITVLAAFIKFTFLPALIVSGGAALAGFALYTCFQRCFPGQHNHGNGNDPDFSPFRLPSLFGRRAEGADEPAEPHVRGRHPRNRVRGGRDQNENRGARGFGDFLSGLGKMFGRGRGNLGAGGSEEHVGVGTGERTRSPRLRNDHVHMGERPSGGRDSGRGNLGEGNVRLGDRALTRHQPGRSGRQQPMPGLLPKGSQVGGRTPAPALAPGRGVPLGGRSPAPPLPPPSHPPALQPVGRGGNIVVGAGSQQPQDGPHVGVGTGALTGNPPARRGQVSGAGKIIVGGGKGR